MSEHHRLVVESTQSARRLDRERHVGRELWIGSRNPGVGSVDGVARKHHSELGIEECDVPRGVTGSVDHGQAEQLVTVTDGRDRPRALDAGNVCRVRKGYGVGYRIQHLRQAPDVVAVKVSQDNGADLIPIGADRAQRCSNGRDAACGSCVDDRRLPVTHHDIRRHKT